MHRVATLMLLLMPTIAPAARAAAPQGFGETRFGVFNGKVVFTVTTDNGPRQKIAAVDMRPVLDDAWRRARPEVVARLRRLNGTKAGGVSIYDVDPDIPAAVRLEAKPTDGGHLIRLEVRGCSVAFKSTTPDVRVGPFRVGAGSYADPKVRLSFDVLCDVSLHATASGDVSARLESVTIQNVSARGANAIGWLLQVITTMTKVIGGPDLQNDFHRIVENLANSGMKKQLEGAKRDVRARLPLRLKGTRSIIFDMEGQTAYVNFLISTKPFQPQVIK